jgi:glycosyltransferase involved in cell wall biosynthesis
MHFAGAVTGPERNELFSNCLFFVSPSRNEGLPLTLLEAMSFGRCCIASNIPAHEEIIQDRVTGFLFDTSDKSKFLETTREALALPLKWRHGMGVEARVRVKGNYSWEKTVDLLERTYEALSEGEGRN